MPRYWTLGENQVPDRPGPYLYQHLGERSGPFLYEEDRVPPCIKRLRQIMILLSIRSSGGLDPSPCRAPVMDWVPTTGLSPLEIESDAAVVVGWIVDSKRSESDMGLVVDSIRLLLQDLSSCVIKSIFRRANNVAYT
ncbi:hypothetical protein LWI28_006350 [Acer negundo]|uniref:RNase H type-1 domain-containing protein n=1 Tax=Acer negundo TaxID=4023 RepID=A0AAD5JLV9_ACENE|nr:hypothetical protein LWI28_006350 [Acer negundo]